MPGDPLGALDAFALSADGTELVVSDVGVGPVVIVVHGAGDSAGSWRALAEALADRFRVLCLERQLYGRSGVPRSVHSIDREVEDVVSVIAAVGEPAVILGHSAGAVVALEVALTRPSLLKALALYEPPLRWADRGARGLDRAQEALVSGDRAAAARIFLGEVAGAPPEAIEQVTTAPQLATFWTDMQSTVDAQIVDGRTVIASGQHVDRYRNVGVPTLLLGGSESPPALVDALDALESTLPLVERCPSKVRVTLPT